MQVKKEGLIDAYGGWKQMPERKIMVCHDMTNMEFFDRFAGPGMIGLVGGSGSIDRAIREAEAPTDERRRASLWSHAFICQGRRHDGCHWLIECDLTIQKQRLNSGVHEARIAKYAEEHYPNVAVLDLGLEEEQVSAVLGAALSCVADGVGQSLREPAGVVVAMPAKAREQQRNILARNRSATCSAFVAHIFREVGLGLLDDSEKDTTPERLARMAIPHTAYLLTRDERHGPVVRMIERVRRHKRE